MAMPDIHRYHRDNEEAERQWSDFIKTDVPDATKLLTEVRKGRGTSSQTSPVDEVKANLEKIKAIWNAHHESDQRLPTAFVEFETAQKLAEEAAESHNLTELISRETVDEIQEKLSIRRDDLRLEWAINALTLMRLPPRLQEKDHRPTGLNIPAQYRRGLLPEAQVITSLLKESSPTASYLSSPELDQALKLRLEALGVLYSAGGTASNTIFSAIT